MLQDLISKKLIGGPLVGVLAAATGNLNWQGVAVIGLYLVCQTAVDIAQARYGVTPKPPVA